KLFLHPGIVTLARRHCKPVGARQRQSDSRMGASTCTGSRVFTRMIHLFCNRRQQALKGQGFTDCGKKRCSAEAGWVLVVGVCCVLVSRPHYAPFSAAPL